MKLSYNEKTNEFTLILDGDELGTIRYVLGNEIPRQEAKVSYFKHMKQLEEMKSEQKYLKEITKVNKDLERITLAWARKG